MWLSSDSAPPLGGSRVLRMTIDLIGPGLFIAGAAVAFFAQVVARSHAAKAKAAGRGRYRISRSVWALIAIAVVLLLIGAGLTVASFGN